jgi:mRNA interferase MazF
LSAKYLVASKANSNSRTSNGLSKDSGADAFQTKSVSETRFVRRLGVLTAVQVDEIAEAIALCVGVP